MCPLIHAVSFWGCVHINEGSEIRDVLFKGAIYELDGQNSKTFS